MPNPVAADDQAVAGWSLAPVLVSSQNLRHAAALNFITPPHDIDDDSNTRRTGRITHW